MVFPYGRLFRLFVAAAYDLVHLNIQSMPSAWDNILKNVSRKYVSGNLHKHLTNIEAIYNSPLLEADIRIPFIFVDPSSEIVKENVSGQKQ